MVKTKGRNLETSLKREKGGNQKSLFKSDPETLLRERADAPEHTSKLKLDVRLDCKILSQRFNTFIWRIRDSCTVGSEEVYPGLRPCTDRFFPFHMCKLRLVETCGAKYRCDLIIEKKNLYVCAVKNRGNWYELKENCANKEDLVKKFGEGSKFAEGVSSDYIVNDETFCASHLYNAIMFFHNKNMESDEKAQSHLEKLFYCCAETTRFDPICWDVVSSFFRDHNDAVRKAFHYLVWEWGNISECIFCFSLSDPFICHRCVRHGQGSCLLPLVERKAVMSFQDALRTVSVLKRKKAADNLVGNAV